MNLYYGNQMIDKTLEERGEVYGDYEGGLKFRRAVLDLIMARYAEVNKMVMPVDKQDLFLDIIGKLSRLAVTPSHSDSFHDLAGYSILVEGILNESK